MYFCVGSFRKERGSISIIMRTKANIELLLLIAFAVALTIGVILHLKSHGIIVEPRSALKVIHWVFGYAMTALVLVHWAQFRKMLGAMKKKFRWFYADTQALIILFLATLLTETVKLLAPVKIPHLGLWHYAIGIAMSLTVVVHLFKGIPAWLRMRKLQG